MYAALREKQPNFHEKVTAIHGDILEEGLGIKDADKKILQENVHLVFHSAATIRFDEPLKWVSTILE